MSIRIEDTTRACTAEDYQKAIQCYLERVSHFQDLVSIYQFGSVSAPGISDIDLIVVLRDPLSESQAEDYRINCFGEKIRYIFMHQPFILSESAFQNLSHLYYVSNLRHIYGKNLPVRELDYEEACELPLVLNIKRLGILLRNFSSYLAVEKVPSREALTNLNSLNYTIDGLSRILSVNLKEWEHYSQRTKKLRKNWFALNPALATKELSDLLSMAYYIINQLIRFTDKFLNENKSALVDNCQEGIDFEAYNRLTVYSHHWEAIHPQTKLSFHRDFINFQSAKIVGPVFRNFFKRSVIFLPTSFILFKNGTFEPSAVFGSDQLISTLHARNQLVHEHLNFLIRNGFDFGNFTDGRLMREKLAKNRSCWSRRVEHWISIHNERWIRKRLVRHINQSFQY